jgi:integrase
MQQTALARTPTLTPEYRLAHSDVGRGGEAVRTYLMSLQAASSRATQLASLDTIAKWLHPQATGLTYQWFRLRKMHVIGIRTWLASKYRPATCNKMLAALRGVLKQCSEVGILPEADLRRILAISGVKGVTLPAGRSLSLGEIAALLATCASDPGTAGRRDAAAISILYAGGLRRGELVALNLADLDLEAGTLKVLHAKGNKERTVDIAAGAVAAVGEWLRTRGAVDGPLFIPILKSGRLVQRRLTTAAVFAMLRRRGAAAGIPPFSPHDFRRTMAGDMLALGHDLAVVSRVLGHSSVLTTARYDRRPAAAQRQASLSLHVPFVPHIDPGAG